MYTPRLLATHDKVFLRSKDQTLQDDSSMVKGPEESKGSEQKCSDTIIYMSLAKCLREKSLSEVLLLINS